MTVLGDRADDGPDPEPPQALAEFDGADHIAAARGDDEGLGRRAAAALQDGEKPRRLVPLDPPPRDDRLASVLKRNSAVRHRLGAAAEEGTGNCCKSQSAQESPLQCHRCKVCGR